MNLYELDVGWAQSANEHRYLRWELQTCADVVAVFSTSRAGIVAVLFAGDRLRFADWTRELAPEAVA